jgi:hypothetical protein
MPEHVNLNMSKEDNIQIEFMNWVRKQAKHDPRFKLIYHVPNGGKRNKREAARFKLMGVVPGIPDIFVPITSNWFSKCDPRPEYFGLYIEFKTEKGKLSEDQSNIIPLLESQGYKVVVCRSAEEAIKTVCDYLAYDPVEA